MRDWRPVHFLTGLVDSGYKPARAARRNLTGSLVAMSKLLASMKAEKAKRSDPRTPTLAFTSIGRAVELRKGKRRSEIVDVAEDGRGRRQTGPGTRTGAGGGKDDGRAGQVDGT